jgi:integrase
MRKLPTHLDFFEHYDRFVKSSFNGKRLQKNGKRLRQSSAENYIYLRKLLHDFATGKKFPLRIRAAAKTGKRDFTAEKNYWKKFYKKFTDYLYNDLGHFDNYVGNNIKMLRVFFNYLNQENGMKTGEFHKLFYVRKEEIPIITLLPEQLNFLIYNEEFESGLTSSLQTTKDIFVVGCTVALRVSDLMNLKPANLEKAGEHYYLKVTSKKTQTFTRIRLPSYCVRILHKYKDQSKTLLPSISNVNLNKNIKRLMEAAGWTQPVLKTRERRGIVVPVYKNSRAKEAYRFCDLITSHSMRRTAITTMLCLNMPEMLVRQISGHSANSKEFFRYVKLSQSYVDQETDKVFEKLERKMEPHQEEKSVKIG